MPHVSIARRADPSRDGAKVGHPWLARSRSIKIEADDARGYFYVNNRVWIVALFNGKIIARLAVPPLRGRLPRPTMLPHETDWRRGLVVSVRDGGDCAEVARCSVDAGLDSTTTNVASRLPVGRTLRPLRARSGHREIRSTLWLGSVENRGRYRIPIDQYSFGSFFGASLSFSMR